MLSFFMSLNFIWQALIAGLFTFIVTVLGAAVVFFFKKVNKSILDIMLGFAAGVMLSASFFSLLNPALELAGKLNMIPWLIAFIGFTLGGLLLFIGDKVFPKIIKNTSKKGAMLILSIGLHNIPEGLAVGVAFGSIKYHIEGATIMSALLLTLGIALQNFPEGTAVSLPLKREGMSSKKAFIIGSLTAIVEPISSVIGALLVIKVREVLPLLLSFAAGAMIYVVIEELLPENQKGNKKGLMSMWTILGFGLMMILDVAFS